MKVPRKSAKEKRKARPQTALIESDYTELDQLLDDAATANRDEFLAAKQVTLSRAHLQMAEFNLASSRHKSREIHAKLAPLWHRLPA